jgi:hypothetical protein
VNRVWLISDLQVPFHDQKAVDAVAQCITDIRSDNDIVVTVGDEQDFQTISRWAVGTELEWERSIGRDRDATVEVLRNLGVDHCIRSNHTDRLWEKIRRGAPGFIGLPELEIEQFWRLDELGIQFHREGYRVPGTDWIVLHGDESGVSQVAGQTAANLVKKVGLSVACGHTHRLGLQPYSFSVHGKITRTLFGFEVGNLMDIRKAKYAKTHNWQQGFGLLYVDGKKVHPVPVPIVNRSFIVEGERYSW